SYMQSKGIAPLGVDVLTPDLAVMAKASGRTVKRLENGEDFTKTSRELAQAARPAMLIFGDDVRQAFQREA
ncbi:MAG: hypothetical protein DI604_37195, partial [Delftia acidovorans]